MSHLLCMICFEKLGKIPLNIPEATRLEVDRLKGSKMGLADSVMIRANACGGSGSVKRCLGGAIGVSDKIKLSVTLAAQCNFNFLKIKSEKQVKIKH